MPQMIEIEGELARIVERRTISEHKLADVMPFIERRIPLTFPIIPQRTRALHINPTNPERVRMELIVEMDPSVHTITLAQENETNIKIAIPWTLFHFSLVSHGDPNGTNWSFNDYRAFFSRNRLTSMDQRVLPALLPNVFEDGRICFGDTGVDAQLTLTDRIDKILNEFYLTHFNNIGHVRPNYLPWNARRFKKWVDETTANGPFAWTAFPEWDETGEYGRRHRWYAIKDLFDEETTRTEPIMVTGAIPDLPIAPTFGRAEEWARGLTAVDRFRLRTALNNIEVEAPDLFAPPDPEPDDDEEEDF